MQQQRAEKKYEINYTKEPEAYYKNIGLKVAVSPQVCFAIWTSMMNIHALRNTAGDKATAQPTSGNKKHVNIVITFRTF